ncbi:MAG: cytidyltransferase, partial [Bacteroidota bacterium]
SQDAIGLVFPGLNRIYYGEPNSYWPSNIETLTIEESLTWLEAHLWLLPLGQREDGYSVLENTHISKGAATALATAANTLFQAAQNQDAIALGKAMTASFNAQIAMFPNMTSPEINQTIHELYAMHPWVLGHKLSGAGGGGYLVLFAEQPIPNTLQIKIRRAEH